MYCTMYNYIQYIHIHIPFVTNRVHVYSLHSFTDPSSHILFDLFSFRPDQKKFFLVFLCLLLIRFGYRNKKRAAQSTALDPFILVNKQSRPPQPPVSRLLSVSLIKQKLDRPPSVVFLSFLVSVGGKKGGKGRGIFFRGSVNCLLSISARLVMSPIFLFLIVAADLYIFT